MPLCGSQSQICPDETGAFPNWTQVIKMTIIFWSVPPHLHQPELPFSLQVTFSSIFLSPFHLVLSSLDFASKISQTQRRRLGDDFVITKTEIVFLVATTEMAQTFSAFQWVKLAATKTEQPFWGESTASTPYTNDLEVSTSTSKSPTSFPSSLRPGTGEFGP